MVVQAKLSVIVGVGGVTLLRVGRALHLALALVTFRRDSSDGFDLILL